MSANPAALQLRYLQTLLELGSSQASTIVFPLPIDLLKPLLNATQLDGTEHRPPADETSARELEAAERAQLEAEVESEIAQQVERVKDEVERVQADVASRKP